VARFVGRGEPATDIILSSLSQRTCCGSTSVVLIDSGWCVCVVGMNACAMIADMKCGELKSSVLYKVIVYLKYHMDRPVVGEIAKPIPSTNLRECGVSDWDVCLHLCCRCCSHSPFPLTNGWAPI